MSILKDLLEKRDAASNALAEITQQVETESRTALTDDEEARSSELLAEIDALDGRIEEENRNARRDALLAEARQRVAPAPDVQVTAEARVYGPDSPHSFYNDLIRFQGGPMWPDHYGAQQRLAEWGHQVEREIANASKEGRAAERQLREQYRPMKPEVAKQAMQEVRDRGRLSLDQKSGELRGITTGGGATASAAGGGGAAFVTPVFFVDDYAPYREFGRSFVDQCNKQPLPDYGMEVYIPAVTGPAAVASQTEGSAVTETDPSMGYLSGSLITKAGQVTVSQQLLDRAGPNFSFDRMIFDQLHRDYAPQVDAYVLAQALSGATTQTWTGSFALSAASGAGGFYGQVSKAKAAIRTTAGTVLNASHLFLQPARWEFMAAWADTQGRPVVVPDYAGVFNAAAAGNATGDVGIEGRTGYRFNGLPVFTDGNVPAPATGADQAIVGDLMEVYVYEGTPVPRVIPQTLAQNLQVLLQLYAYMTAIVRYPKGIVAIFGTGMGTISYS